MRVFAGRDSSGVRGIKLQNGDEVISLSVLRHIDATPAEREAYLKLANASAAAATATPKPRPLPPNAEAEESVPEVTLSPNASPKWKPPRKCC